MERRGSRGNEGYPAVFAQSAVLRKAFWGARHGASVPLVGPELAEQDQCPTQIRVAAKAPYLEAR